MKKRKHKPQRFFVQLFIDSLDAPAWREMSVGARVLYLALKRRYNRKTQQAVFLSARNAAQEVKLNKDSVRHKYLELEHYGFIRCVKPARFGNTKGKAALYQLTDEPFDGKPPSMDFVHWNGIPFLKSVPPFRTPMKSVPPFRTHCPSVSDTSVPPFRTVRKGRRQKSPENGGSPKT
jgi:hypothetical protein